MAGKRPGDEASGPLSLFALLAGGAALGLLLWQIDGPPQLASGAPDWAHIREVLTGSELADADVVAAATTVAWLALGYLAFTVGLRLLVTLADRLSGGARWARTGMRLSNLVTIPAVRRVVDGGIAGTLLLASWAPAEPRAALASEPAAVVAVAARPAPDFMGHQGPTPQDAGARQEQEHERFVEYTVVRGDYLWDIARRLYGDGSRFVEIFEANRGRVMPGDEVFDDPRLIQPGWVLRVPLPALNLSVDDGAVTYRVRRGDHLWGIAERFLGDGFRWVEIWELNRGRDMGGAWRFVDPNLIYPGWLLELPLEVGDGPPPLETPTPIEPTATPVASEPTVIPAAASPDAVEVDNADANDGGAGGGWDWEWPSLPRPVLITAAGFVVIGGTALFVQRLHRAGALRLHRRAGRGDGTGDAGRVALATKALQAALADYDFADSTPLLVVESGRRLDFTVACPAGDAEALVALHHDLARRLACDVAAETIGSTRVALTLSGFQRLAGLLAGEATAPPALVVPVGADAEGVTYLNLAAAGSVAVAGAVGQRKQLLRSWVATLSTTCSPEELSFRVESEAARLLDADLGLPHFVGADVESDATDLAEELDEVVQSRGAGGVAGHPLLAVFDLVEGGAELLEGVLRYGPPAGVFVIAGAPQGQSADRLGAFAASIAFSESGDGADGDEDGTAPGEILLRIGRDEPLVLERVHVRRDTSRRWSESAEVATLSAPFGSASDDALRRPEAGEGVPDAEQRSFEPPHHDAGLAPDAIPTDVPHPEFAADAEYEANAVTDAPAVSDRTPAAEAGEPVINTDEQSAPAEEAEEQAGGAAADVTLGVATGGGETTEQGEDSPESPEPRHAATGGSERPSVATRQAALLTHEDLPPAEAASERAAPVFSVRCLGRFEMRLGELPVDRWTLEKARELLAFLATHGGDAVPRATVAEVMWPGYPWDASVRHMLANAVSGLRGAVRSAAGDDKLQPVVTAHQRYQLQTALFRIDLDSFESSLRRAAGLPDVDALEEYERATALYRGDFLEGELFPWVDAYRTDYQQRLVDGARRGAAIAERLDEPERAARLYQVILEREPADEEAARGWMRHLAAAGDINGARKVYKALTEALQRVLDDPRAGPASETRALLAELVSEAEGGVA